MQRLVMQGVSALAAEPASTQRKRQPGPARPGGDQFIYPIPKVPQYTNTQYQYRARFIGQVRRPGVPRNIAAQGEGQLGGLAQVDLLEDSPQSDDVEVFVRDLDAQHALARDGGLDPDGAGGKGHGQIYLNGEPAHRIDNKDLIEHIVELCEKKAAEIEASRGKLEAAQ